jgi:hypothetical protein
LLAETAAYRSEGFERWRWRMTSPELAHNEKLFLVERRMRKG